jgi:hypothetical protein
MYFDAQADAGLTRGTLAAGLGLLFWLALGTAIVGWYDHKHFYRLHPETLAYVNKVVQDRRAEKATPAAAPATTAAAPATAAPSPSGAGQPASEEAKSTPPPAAGE